jgi:class 3 adenylate cyclase/WD40 repeat protein/tRNA A-37 threonylcarbamoyl transferase component Bud32
MTTVIRERYELLETLGGGGEARVVKALDRQHGRFVALKIRPARTGEARDLLLNEARILLAVPPHSSLPLVREDFFDGDDYVVAMDWVDGTNLAMLVHDRGRPGLAPSSVLAYLSDAAQALTHLHVQSPPVIHGDVKPGNLILTTGGRVKLVDFGMSSAPNALRRRSGTPGFRAPELAASGLPSRASDVYALAASAFALLTGSIPAGVLPAWEGIDPAQAQQLEAAIRLGMATDPARRPASPGEFVERLRAGWAEALPTGVITFCLTDLEGSIALWESHPAAMAEALVRHDELISDHVSAHGGRLIESMGESDSTVSVFDSAGSALQAALAATRQLAAEPWPAELRLAARFALHTGEAERRGTHYFGPTVNLAARLRAQADGGQIFLSAVTAELVADHLPDGCSLVDLGPHRLKGVAAESIHALKGAGVSAPLPGTECPYRGLVAFEPEDRAYFFGREEVVAELIGRLVSGRLMAVIGASGSGKSSVLRAGVIAAVQAGEVPGIDRARVLTPGSAPTPAAGPGACELIVFDQFEELFTLCDDADRRRAFIDELLACDAPVAIGMRADMYGRLGAHPSLARAVAANQVLLGAMSQPELERAVTEPARLAGLRLEPGLVELTVRDVAGEPGALPLLSHALRATWERRDGRTLTVAGYRESGGVAAALAQTADEVVGSMPPDRRQLARNVFVRLTDVGEGGAATRRRVPIDELVPEGVSAGVVQPLLQRLANARLVTLGEGTAEVAHEVLLREWPTLRGWLDEDRDGLRLHRQLGDAARMWEAGGREPSDLYRGARLAAAADWAAGHGHDLNAGERSFIAAGVEAADRVRRVQLRANRRLRGLLAGALALLFVAVLAGVVALVQRGHAQAQALTSDAERVGAQALTEQNVDSSLLLGVTAVRLQNRPETRSDLLAVLQRNPALIRLIRPFGDLLTAVQVSPDGRLLAVADSAGIVRFIDSATWRRAGADVDLGSPVAPRAMSFSPDGRTLMAVTVGADRSTLEAIDVATRHARALDAWRGVELAPPNGTDGVAYAPNGRLVAVSLTAGSGTNGADYVKRLAMVAAGSGRIDWQRRYPITSAIEEEPHLAFLPGGELLTSDQHGDTYLWDPATGRILRRYPIGGLPAVSADGREVALGRNSPDNDAIASAWVTVLDLHTGRFRTLAANVPTAWIRGISFIAGGTEIVADAFDGVHVWAVASGTIAESYVGQPGQRSVMAIDPSRTTVIVGSQDGSVTAFDLTGRRRLGQAFSWETPALSCSGDTPGPCDAISRHTALLADTRSDGSVAIVNLHTLHLVALLHDHENDDAVTFLPDGETVVHGGLDGRVTFWDVRTGGRTRTLRFADPVGWLAASPDGKLLAVQTQAVHSSDSRVDVVRIATGQVLQSHPVADGTGAVEFSPDGREVVALGCCQPSSTLVAWDARTGRRLFAPRTFADQADALDITPDSREIGLGTEDGQALFLDARTGREAQPPLQAAAGSIGYLSFSPDGHALTVAGADNAVNVWDLRTRKHVGNPFGPYPGEVPPTYFEPDGELLIVLPGNAVQWPTDVGTWERFACGAVGRNLTRAEWAELLPNRSYQRVCPAVSA